MNLLCVRFYISAKLLRFSHQNKTDFPQETDFSLVIKYSYVDDVNILGGSVHTVKENAESLVVATKKIGKC